MSLGLPGRTTFVLRLALVTVPSSQRVGVCHCANTLRQVSAAMQRYQLFAGAKRIARRLCIPLQHFRSARQPFVLGSQRAGVRARLHQVCSQRLRVYILHGLRAFQEIEPHLQGPSQLAHKLRRLRGQFLRNYFGTSKVTHRALQLIHIHVRAQVKALQVVPIDRALRAPK